MGVVDRRRELFEHVARLRRVGRLLPESEDLAAVRLALEKELGATASRRLAARVLGVSHTALERWVKSGDVPLVLTRAGRREVPVTALLDLYESVRSDDTGMAGRHPLSTVLRTQQDDAARCSFDWSCARHVGTHGDHSHRRGLAYHRAVAARLQPQMVADAKYVLYRWRHEGRIDPQYAEGWSRILGLPLQDIREAITAIGDDASDLRQNSPFAGALTESERRRIVAEVG